MKNKNTNDFNSNKTTDTVPIKKLEPDKDVIRQQSRYSIDDRPSPDNNIFHEGPSNPLSSKGN